MGHVTMTTPLLEVVYHHRLGWDLLWSNMKSLSPPVTNIG